MTPAELPDHYRSSPGWGTDSEKIFIDHLGYWSKPMVNSRLKLLLKYKKVLQQRFKLNNMMDRDEILKYINRSIEKECLA
jgi:hypothetical protein